MVTVKKAAVRPPKEVDRLSRPQPPRPIPVRAPAVETPGLLAHTLVGHRVVK